MVNSEEPRTRRNATRSVATAVRAAATMAIGAISHHETSRVDSP